MSFFSDIGNAISGAFKSVCDTVSKVGSSVAAFANDIKPTLGPLLTTLAQVVPHPVVKALANFANALLHVLAIFKPDETVEDMGERAMQAAEDGITPDKFESFDEYMAELRNFELDPEVAEKRSKVEKFTAGLGIATAGIEDKFNMATGSLNNLWLLPVTNSEYFTPDRVKSLLENGKLIGDVSAYLEKRMGGEEASAFEKNYEINLEGEPMNEGELGKLYDALDSSRAEWAKLQQQLKTGD
jgi:hypothetical protein